MAKRPGGLKNRVMWRGPEQKRGDDRGRISRQRGPELRHGKVGDGQDAVDDPVKRVDPNDTLGQERLDPVSLTKISAVGQHHDEAGQDEEELDARIAHVETVPGFPPVIDPLRQHEIVRVKAGHHHGGDAAAGLDSLEIARLSRLPHGRSLSICAKHLLAAMAGVGVKFGGRHRIRTCDPLGVNEVL